MQSLAGKIGLGNLETLGEVEPTDLGSCRAKVGHLEIVTSTMCEVHSLFSSMREQQSWNEQSKACA